MHYMTSPNVLWQVTTQEVLRLQLSILCSCGMRMLMPRHRASQKSPGKMSEQSHLLPAKKSSLFAFLISAIRLHTCLCFVFVERHGLVAAAKRLIAIRPSIQAPLSHDALHAQDL